MITKAISSYVVDQIIKETTPSMNYENCLNKKQKKNKCTVCMDICPAKVIKTINMETRDWSRCTNCGLCAAHCPTRAISYSQHQIQSFLEALNDQQDTIVISCQKHNSKTILKTQCIGSLPWEYLAALALKKKVIFVTKHCDSCDQSCYLEKNIDRLRYFFKDDYKAHFEFSKQDDHHQQRNVSRRQLFKKANQTSLMTLSSLLPTDTSHQELKFSYMLDKLMRQTNQSYGWIIPIISECNGCGVCEKLCPRHAIRIQQNPDKNSVVFYPTLCNHCGQCQKSCIHHFITGYGIARVSSLGPILLFETEDVK